MKYKLIKPINQNYSALQQILTNRGISINEIQHYLNTTDEDINSYNELGENLLKKAASYLIQTIQKKGSTLVVIDSDCDGFTSAAIILNYLHDLFPQWVENHVKYILHEGKQHGIVDHFEKIQNKYQLIIIPDAGSNDAIECTNLAQEGTKIIVLDHHKSDVKNPGAVIINNQLSKYPNKNFSGAGIVWQFCRYLDKLLKIDNADNYLDLVALGNCADMMSLTSIETKHLINKGFQQVKNPFFYMLAEKNEFSMKGKVNYMSVAFYIAPYVNAISRSGTLEQKNIVFQSMLKYKAFNKIPSTKRGHKLGQKQTLVEQAMRVVVNVKSRQTKAQQNGLITLTEMIEQQNLLSHKVLLFLLKPNQIDRNIAGLIANKFMAKYQRPVCVLTQVIEYDDDQLPWEPIKSDPIVTFQGSARGCEKVGIVDFKSICAETGCIEYCTGHPNAFGIGIKEDNIQNFIEATDAALADISDEAIYYVDYIYRGNDINPEDLLTIADMEQLWGKDIDEPFLCVEGLNISADMVTVYQKKDNTLKITLPNGISLLKFKASDEQCEKLQNIGTGYYEINVIGRANKNEWNGYVSPQIFIEQYEIVDSHKYIF